MRRARTEPSPTGQAGDRGTSPPPPPPDAPGPSRRRGGTGARTVAIAAAAALAGGASVAGAQGLIDGRDLIPGSVTRAKLQTNIIGAEQIAAGAVTSSELRARAVQSVNIAPQAVTGAKIADASVTRRKIARGAVTGTQIADGSVTADDLAPGAALPDVVVRTLVATVPPGPATTLEITCEAGQVALSGGYSGVPPENANILQNRPIPAAAGTVPTGWSVIARNSTGAAIVVDMYAVCARR